MGIAIILYIYLLLELMSCWDDECAGARILDFICATCFRLTNTHSLLCTDAEPWNAQSPIHIHIHIRTDTNRIQQINCIKNEII